MLPKHVFILPTPVFSCFRGASEPRAARGLAPREEALLHRAWSLATEESGIQTRDGGRTSACRGPTRAGDVYHARAAEPGGAGAPLSLLCRWCSPDSVPRRRPARPTRRELRPVARGGLLLKQSGADLLCTPENLYGFMCTTPAPRNKPYPRKKRLVHAESSQIELYRGYCQLLVMKMISQHVLSWGPN